MSTVCLHTYLQSLHTCRYTHVYTHVDTDVDTDVYIHVYTHVYIHVCTYVYTHVYTHVHTTCLHTCLHAGTHNITTLALDGGVYMWAATAPTMAMLSVPSAIEIQFVLARWQCDNARFLTAEKLVGFLKCSRRPSISRYMTGVAWIRLTSFAIFMTCQS